MNTRKMAYMAVIVAMASAVHFLEGTLPPLIPTLPGAKMGLANVFSLFTLQLYTARDALAVTLLRCLVGTLLIAGTPSGLLYALAGGVASWAVMAAIKKALGNKAGLTGQSVAGAATHNVAQVGVASMMLGSGYVFAYLPWLLVLSVPTGIFVGFLCRLCIKAIEGMK